MNYAYEAFLRKVAEDWERAGGVGATDFLDYAKAVTESTEGHQEPGTNLYAEAQGDHIIDWIDAEWLGQMGYDLGKIGDKLDDVLNLTCKYVYNAFTYAEIDYDDAIETAMERVGLKPAQVRVAEGLEDMRGNICENMSNKEVMALTFDMQRDDAR